jgi:peptide/nickel transport system permease protein
MPDTLLAPAPVTRRRSRLRGLPCIPVVVLTLVLVSALFPWAFTSYDPDYGDTAMKLSPPSPQFWLGTDHLGRDLYTRLVFGASSTILSAAVAVVIGFVVGGLLGLLSGFLGGWVDNVITGVLEVIMAIPGLLLALIIVASFGYETINTSIAVGIASIATFGRLMRTETRGVKSQLYVEAAQVLGAKKVDALFSHVLPNSLTSVLSVAIVQFGSVILSIAALAFLGYGSPPPASDWGLLVANGKDYLLNSPWLVFFPSLAIVFVVVSLNRLSAHIGRITR